MFNGIIEEIGIVEQINFKKNLTILKVRAQKISKGVKPGASIAVDGACLTVTGAKSAVLTFDIMRESLLATTLGSLKIKTKVNLERALKANGRINGHFVTGHVDTVGVIKEKVAQTNYIELRIGLTKDVKRTIVPKGSICLDGVSLTVGKVKKLYFSVYLIPFTKQATTLGSKKKGDKVNIETDVLAKYVLNKN